MAQLIRHGNPTDWRAQAQLFQIALPGADSGLVIGHGVCLDLQAAGVESAPSQFFPLLSLFGRFFSLIRRFKSSFLSSRDLARNPRKTHAASGSEITGDACRFRITLLIPYSFARANRTRRATQKDAGRGCRANWVRGASFMQGNPRNLQFLGVNARQDGKRRRTKGLVAEAVGFEPTVGFPLRSVSNRVLSASQPRFRRLSFSHPCARGQEGKASAPPGKARSRPLAQPDLRPARPAPHQPLKRKCSTSPSLTS